MNYVQRSAFRVQRFKGGLVGARGFEPPTPASRTQCATRLRYAPIQGVNGMPNVSATARYFIRPSARLRPFARAGSVRTACSGPRSAKRRIKGSDALVKAKVDVCGTIPGMFGTA